jgi:pimeloyl-ACP methyl ester carboxylesterase
MVNDAYFDSGGVQIRYSDRGEGEPIVLIHGGFGNADVWDELGFTSTLMDAGYRVVAFDMRGHGKSDKPHAPLQYGLEMSADVGRLLDHLDINRAHVCGYSMGAVVANNFRSTHPERLLTVVLGGGGVLSSESVFFRRHMEFADLIERGALEPVIRELLPPEGPALTEEEIDAICQPLISGNDLQAISAILRAQNRVEPIENLRSNAVPTLALIGELDPNKRDVDTMAKYMSNLEVVVIRGADHPFAMSNPTFLQALLKFLAKHQEVTPSG